MPAPHELAWWQREVIYEIYPRSFQDSNADGVGDLEGIRSRLDYLSWLGIGAIWICPIYPSPMVDCGYDICDYCAIDPVFGSLADFDRLLAEAHERNIRVILDFVPNHTSDQHPWFIESASSRDNPKRDWYIWRDGTEDGLPPNNWESEFAGSAWAFDRRTRQFYYHAFLKEQPDLNWDNPDVRQAMLNVMRFWLKRGVDGLRVDAATNLVEDRLLRDDPPARRKSEAALQGDKGEGNLSRHEEERDLQPYRYRRVFCIDRPETHDHIAEMREVLDEFPDRVLIGEVHLPVARAMSYYGRARPNFHLPFNFGLVNAEWSDVRNISAVIDQFTILLPDAGWPNWVLGNHDESRIATRAGPNRAKLAAILLMTLKGTPFMYYGDEIGMTDADLPVGKQRDPRGQTMGSHRFSRDPQRTPMLWRGGSGAGFTTGEPWLPIDTSDESCNVAAQRDDADSLLNLYRKLIALRTSEPALQGDYVPMPLPKNMLVFERRTESQRVIIALNFGETEKSLAIPAPKARCLLSTESVRQGQIYSGALSIRALEGAIFELVK